jgi:polysaccharide biosynthesis/export protein
MNVTPLALALAAAALCAATRPSFAQEARASLIATRPALEEHAALLEHAGQSDSTQRAAEIRTRLVQVDFQLGDRIQILVEGEKELSDTFTVAPGKLLSLPGIGDVPLQGVLRSELEPYLTRVIGSSLRNPIVRARAFIRLSVQGAVARPGYYGVPAQALVSDPMMIAGGTSPDANVKKLRIERGGKPILEGDALQRAIAQGLTIDEAGLMAGDQYVIPGRRHGSTTETLSFAGLLLGLPITIYELTRIF